jgi:hypothetical protein
VLLGGHLAVKPNFVKLTQDTAVPGPIAVPVGRTFPHTNCRQMGWPQRGNEPLVDGVIRNPVDPDLAVAPGLDRRPFDAVKKIFRLSFGQ